MWAYVRTERRLTRGRRRLCRPVMGDRRRQDVAASLVGEGLGMSLIVGANRGREGALDLGADRGGVLLGERSYECVNERLLNLGDERFPAGEEVAIDVRGQGSHDADVVLVVNEEARGRAAVEGEHLEEVERVVVKLCALIRRGPLAL